MPPRRLEDDGMVAGGRRTEVPTSRHPSSRSAASPTTATIRPPVSGFAPPGRRPLRRAFALQFQTTACSPLTPGSQHGDESRTAASDTMNEATIRLHIEKLPGDRFLATSPDVPGLVAEGRSVAEATEIAQGLARKIAESCIDHGDPLPPALTRLHEPEISTAAASS